jgi:hypothetical protein
MKPFPNNDDLELMWRVAATSSISTGYPLYWHFAKLLYSDLSDEPFPVTLNDDTKHSADS